MVGLYATAYASAKSRVDKSAIVSAIIDKVRSLSPEGGFIKKDEYSCLWYEVGDLMAREKVGQTMRDALHDSYRSSTKAKKQRRLTEQESADESMAAIIRSHFAVSSKVENLQKAARVGAAGELSAGEGTRTKAILQIHSLANRMSRYPRLLLLC